MVCYRSSRCLLFNGQQLERAGFSTLNIDHRVWGLGDTSDLPMTKYQVFPEVTEMTYLIRPVR
jgi:hypothetical protein